MTFISLVIISIVIESESKLLPVGTSRLKRIKELSPKTWQDESVEANDVCGTLPCLDEGKHEFEIRQFRPY